MKTALRRNFLATLFIVRPSYLTRSYIKIVHVQCYSPSTTLKQYSVAVNGLKQYSVAVNGLKQYSVAVNGAI